MLEDINSLAQLGGKYNIIKYMKPRGKPFPKGHKNWNAGKKRSEETKKKISDSHKRLKNILS